MPKRHVVAFPRLATIPLPTPIKADLLRPDVRVSVQRSMEKLPVLGQRNPDAALLIERSIDDYMPSPDGGGGPEHSASTCISRGGRSPEAEYIRRVQADYPWAPEDQTPAERTHRCLMEMLFDMHADRLSAAS